jgi:alpha,alpha-trehalose phosphorylase
MAQAGLEIVLETARIWIGIGSDDREGRFCINEVTGPDEYTALVNNNYYTNAMARMHLRFAADMADQLAKRARGDFARVAGRDRRDGCRSRHLARCRRAHAPAL